MTAPISAELELWVKAATLDMMLERSPLPPLPDVKALEAAILHRRTP